ncbi:MAG TPA: prolipoprotein diacylglyceryl transferase family protein [Sandaracinaceae bacterium]
MIPAFGRIFDWPVPAYFAMLITGFVVAGGLAVRWAKQSKLDHEVIIDLVLVSLIAGVAGARILHVFVDGNFWDYVHMCTDPSLVAWEEVPREACTSEHYRGIWDEAANVCRPSEGDCFLWAQFWAGGLVWYGGLIAAGAYGIYFLWKERFPVLKGLDVGGMVLPLGVFFGRLGCWFGGCCHGVRSDHWSAVSFPPGSPASSAQYVEGLLPSPYLPSLPVLPTQLYEALACLAIAALCMFVVHPRKRFDGQVFVVSMIGYAVVRFVLEFFRDDERGAFLWFSTSQWIGIAIVIGMAVMAARWSKQAREKASAPLADEPAAAA